MPNFIDLIFFFKDSQSYFAENKRKNFEKSWAKTFIPNFIDLIFLLKTRKVNFAEN